jgi:hypothetical protein
MDLDTFFTEWYVFVDDWYKAEGANLMQRRAGPTLKMSDSEVLTIAIAAQWRVGVPWQSERGIVRYLQTHGQQWFPQLLQRSRFNERVRLLWGALVRLQQVLAQQLTSAASVYECVDCVPLPACSLAQAVSGDGHWLWWSQLGYGGNHGGWFFGEQVLLAVNRDSAITGWLVGPANTDDRWMMQHLVSGRAGCPAPTAPLHRPRDGKRAMPLPVGQILPLNAVGENPQRPYLADRGFNGARWQRHWRQYGATVVTIPPDNAADAWHERDKRWLRHHRQVVDTVFSRLCEGFGLFRLQAHSRWGQLTRLAAKFTAYNFGLWLNRQLGRPLGALATLLC